jgi:hypothetical protein
VTLYLELNNLCSGKKENGEKNCKRGGAKNISRSGKQIKQLNN